MIELYAQSGLSKSVWDALFRMMASGSISRNNWIRFRDTCGDWYKAGNIIFDGYADVAYRLNESDIWVKE
ncbi:MAG: hypothetical protein ACI4O4_00805 [Candidatus Ventricola sp.]